MNRFLNEEKVQFSNKTAFLLILIAYLFSFVVRLYYYNWASQIPEFLWHGTLMINNVDGYYYAAGAKEIINHTHVVGNLNPVDLLPSILTAAIAKFFPFLTLDEIILWLPAVFGSLIVVPLFLIGRTLKNDILGFLAALSGSIAWSYYNRTMVGYYDTDMLVIVLLMFVIWGIIEYFVNNNKKMLIFVPLIIIFYEGWYPQSRTILLATLFMSVVYVFYKRDFEKLKFLLLLLLILSKFPYYVNFLLFLIAYYFLFEKKLIDNNKKLFGFFVITLVVLFFSGTFNLLIGKFLAYYNRGNVSKESLHFYSVMKTIREASSIPFSLVAKRISGGEILFALSAVGYLLLLVRKPVLMISLPSVIIGILAHKLGLRFTIYAVPFFALGFAYLAVLIASYFVKKIEKRKRKAVFFILSLLFISPSLLANVEHVIEYKTPTTLLNPEVDALSKLSLISTGNDYVVTWWDYGYPIRYYAGVKTLIDGGRHSGELNFPVSYALTHNQKAAYKLMKLDVEYLDKIRTKREKFIKTKGFLPDMMEKYGFKDVNDFLDSLDTNKITLPKSNRKVFLYLPYRMSDIFATIAMFSSIDLKTGKVKQPVVIPTQVLGAGGNIIKLAGNMSLDFQRGVLNIDKHKVNIKEFVISTYQNSKPKIFEKYYNHPQGYYVLWYRPLNKVLIVDDKYFNSTYVQMFFMNNYNKNLYKLVVSNPFVKIYELK